MTAFDYVVLAVLLGSVVMGMVRGFVAEVMSLAAWLIAFWCAKEFSPAVSAFIPADVPSEGLRLVAAFVLLFFLTWLLAALLRVVLTRLLDVAGLGSMNRFLGTVFGLARGFVLVTILVLVSGLSDLPKQPLWRNALLASPLETIALSLRSWLPPLLAANIRFSA